MKNFLSKKIEGKPKELISGIVIGILISVVLLIILGWFIALSISDGSPPSY